MQCNTCLQTSFLFSQLHSNFSPDNVRISADHVYVPSRQQVDYTVLRIVGVAHLLQQAGIYARLSFDEAMQHIQRGLIVHNMLVYCATSSRLW